MTARRERGRAETGPGDGAPARPASGFDSLYRSRWERLVRMAVGLCGERAVAEEIVQDCFLELSRRWDEIDEPAAYLRVGPVAGG